jgi:hypothetical protein
MPIKRCERGRRVGMERVNAFRLGSYLSQHRQGPFPKDDWVALALLGKANEVLRDEQREGVFSVLQHQRPQSVLEGGNESLGVSR